MRKCFICIIACIVFMNSWTNAAVVADNDGSAFITKAEFDSLKNNFQSQIDAYNSNIDSKIDSAIASYLAGITADTEIDLSSYIDNNGAYGNLIDLSWNSSSSYRMISTTLPYAVQNWQAFTVVASPTWSGNNLTKVDYWSAVFKSPKIDMNGNTVTNNDRGTKKEYRVETVKIGTTNYRMLNHVKVVNIFESIQFLGFPTQADSYNNTTITGWDMENIHQLNIDNLTQQNLEAGCWVDYYRTWDRGATQQDRHVSNISVWKSGSSAITQEYTVDNTHVLAPFSTVQEYVWDPESKVSIAWNSWMRTVDLWPNSSDVYWAGNVSTSGWTHRYSDATKCNPSQMKELYFAWQHLPFKSGVRNESGSNVLAKDSIIYNYWNIDDRNWMQKNGLVLGTVPSGDEVEVICQCCSDVPGTVYFWCGPKYTVIDNWTSSSFGGVKYALTGSNKEEKITLGKIQGGYTIWVLFAPTSTSVNGKLKVNRLFYKKNH